MLRKSFHARNGERYRDLCKQTMPTSESESSDEKEFCSNESEHNSEELPGSPLKRKAKVTEPNIIVETAFDAYFTYDKPGRVQTSSNVYSQLVLPLSAEEYSDAIGSISGGLEPICNVSDKMEHAGIAHGTTIGLSVPRANYLDRYRGQNPLLLPDLPAHTSHTCESSSLEENICTS